MLINKHKKKIRLCCKILFGLYLVVLVYFLFFSELTGRTHMSHCYHYNLTPFKEISRFIVYREVLGFVAVFCNLAGNILIFMPFGFLLPVMIRSFCTFLRVLLAGILFSVCVETIQLFTQVGSFDVDDIMLNSIGTAVGFLIYWFMLKKHRNSMCRHN